MLSDHALSLCLLFLPLTCVLDRKSRATASWLIQDCGQLITISSLWPSSEEAGDGLLLRGRVCPLTYLTYYTVVAGKKNLLISEKATATAAVWTTAAWKRCVQDGEGSNRKESLLKATGERWSTEAKKKEEENQPADQSMPLPNGALTQTCAVTDQPLSAARTHIGSQRYYISRCSSV